MFQHSQVQGFARLLLRAQSELSSLLDAMAPAAREDSHPHLTVKVGSTHIAVSVKGQSIELNCVQGDQEYRIELKTGQTDGPRAKAWLTDRATKQTTELDAAAIFRGDVPPAFKALHEEVTRHLKALLPESVWCSIVTGATASKPAPKPAEPEATANASNATAQGTAAPRAAPHPTEARASAEEGWDVYEIAQRDRPDLRFTGKLVDAVRTPLNRGRWTELHVYQTKAGKFVGVILGRSMLLGESDRAEAQVSTELKDLASFFGHSPLAKALTARLGIRQFVDID